MAGKTSRVLKNLKQTKFEKEENAINLGLGFRFENAKTIDDMSLLDASVLQGVLLVLSHRSGVFMDNAVGTQFEILTKAGFFENTTVKNFILAGDMRKAYKKFFDLYEAKSNSIAYMSLCLYKKVMSVLYEYFDFYDFARKEPKKALALSEMLLSDCYLKTISDGYLRFTQGMSNQEFTTLSAKTAIKEEKDMFAESLTTPLFPECIRFDCDYSLKEDFCKIYNAIRMPWINLHNETELPNRMALLESLDLKNDWSVLFKIMDKKFYKIPKGRIKYDVDEEFKVDYTYDTSLKVRSNKDYQEDVDNFIYRTTRWYPAFDMTIKNAFFNDYVQSVIIEKSMAVDKEKAELNAQIRELKATNRSLTRDMGKLNSENENLKKEQEKNLLLIGEVKQSEEESKELVELRSKVEELKEQNADLTADLKKSENKAKWCESKISDMEKDMHYYDGVEQSLMTLQNENNVLLADIERIEGLENVEDTSDIDKKYQAIKDTPIMFIGGSGDMIQKYLELFPNSENINISDNNANFTIPPRFQYVAIYTKVVKHSFCSRAESLVDKEHIIYLNILNKNLVIDELYKSIVGHKN